MTEHQTTNDFATFYAIRIMGELPPSYAKLQAGHGVYLSAQRRLVSLPKAARFADIDQAEAFLQGWPNRRSYPTQIQLCTLETKTTGESGSEITQQLMRIPYPYRRTAFNWMRGVDVIKLLKSDQPGVFERHYKFLLDYDIDITQPSKVTLLPRKRKPIQLTQSDQEQPRAYFLPKEQRPRGNKEDKSED